MAKKDDQVAKETATDSALKEVKEKKPAAKAETKPAAKTEAKVAAKTDTKPAAKAEAKPAAKTEIKPVAKAEVKTEVKPAKTEVKPAAKPAADIKPAAETVKEPKAKVKSNKKSRLKERYNKEVIPYLKKYFKYKNINQVPRLEKIIINMGLGEDKDNAKSMQTAALELTAIAGQKAVMTKAKHSVANFKIREGMTVGAKVTLRGQRMYEFFDKFVSIALPRVRDFKGVSLKSFDGRGNYAMGVKEQLIFPEISYEQVDRVRGFDVCFVTTAKTDEEARELLKALGMPFKATGGLNG